MLKRYAFLSIGTKYVSDSRKITGKFNYRHPVGQLTLCLIIIVVLLGPLMTFADVGHANEGNIERQISFLLLIGLTLYSSWPVISGSSLLSISWPVCFALIWCWISLSWAIDPQLGFRRLLLTTITIWICYALVRHVGYRATLDALRICFLGAVVTSYLVVIFLPETGIHMMMESDVGTALVGNWRGWLGHKNFAGAVAAICILTFLFDAKHLRVHKRLICILIAGFFLYNSQSKTSAGMLFISATCGYVFSQMSYKLRAYIIPLCAILVCFAGFILSFYKNIIQNGFSDPASFTGRGNIWTALIRYSQDNLLFGSGFGSFWNIGDYSPIYRYGSGYVTKITIGHSGYLDQLVAVGIIGVSLMIFSLIIWPMWLLLRDKHILPERGALISSLLIFAIGHNITESSLFERDSIVSVLLYFAAAMAEYCKIQDGYLHNFSIRSEIQKIGAGRVV